MAWADDYYSNWMNQNVFNGYQPVEYGSLEGMTPRPKTLADAEKIFQSYVGGSITQEAYDRATPEQKMIFATLMATPYTRYSENPWREFNDGTFWNPDRLSYWKSWINHTPDNYRGMGFSEDQMNLARIAAGPNAGWGDEGIANVLRAAGGDVGNIRGGLPADLNSQYINDFNTAIDAKNAEEHAAFKKQLLGTLGAGFAAIAAPAIIGGLAPMGTGISAGNAAASSGGLGSAFSNFTSSMGNALGNFSLGSAAKGAGIGALSGYMKEGDLSGALKGAGIGGLTGGIMGSPGTAINWTNAAPGYATGLEVMGGKGILGGLSSAFPGVTSAVQGLGSSLGSIMPGASGQSTLGSLANIGSSLFSASNDRRAVKDMASAYNQGINQALGANMPFLNSGTAANQRLSSLLGLGGEDEDDIMEMLRGTPGYQFRMDQGTKALNRSLAARGQVFSGNALREAQELGQGLADQTYNDYVRDLMTQSASGQQAASTVGGLNVTQGAVNADAISGQRDIKNKTFANVLPSIVDLLRR